MKHVSQVPAGGKDVRENHALLGGVTVVLCGDFRQILPVMKRSTAADL